MSRPRRTRRTRPGDDEDNGRGLDAEGVRLLGPDEVHNAAQEVDMLSGIIADLPTTSDTDLFAVAALLGYMRQGLLAHAAACPRCKDTPETVDKFIRRAMDRGALKYRLEREGGGHVEGTDNVH